jgi:hypothetical protein
VNVWVALTAFGLLGFAISIVMGIKSKKRHVLKESQDDR